MKKAKLRRMSQIASSSRLIVNSKVKMHNLLKIILSLKKVIQSQCKGIFLELAKIAIFLHFI